jgi:hypothetical protein
MKCRAASRQLWDLEWPQQILAALKRLAPHGAETSFARPRRGALLCCSRGPPDHRQFQAFAYGNALGQARAIEPGVDMETTMRQKTEWQARATEDLRAGRIREGLEAYNRNGLIHRHATQAHARAAIVAEWKSIERGGVDRDGVEYGIETMTNDERCASLTSWPGRLTQSSGGCTVPRSRSSRWAGRLPCRRPGHNSRDDPGSTRSCTSGR